LARAKSTARAEARRRYRASLAAEGMETTIDGDESTSGADAAPARRGLFNFTMPDWRGDIRAFPHELRTNRGWWLATLLLVTGAAAGLIKERLGPETGGMLTVYYQLMVQPPIAIPILVAGFMSRRGPYLIGFVLGLADGIIYVAIALYEIAGVGLPPGVTQDQLWSYSVTTIISAAFFGAAFGWIAFVYKGWLQGSSRRRAEMREKQAQEQRRKARDEARQARSKG
jgi:hypothetical protein